MAKGWTMTIDHNRINKTTVILTLTGRLDTASSPLLEQKIKQWGEDIKELVLDFSGLSYISSMGLRVLLHAKKEFELECRKLTIKNMGASIRDVFEMTGFLQLMVEEEKFIIIRRNDTAADGSPVPRASPQAAAVLLLEGQMESKHIPMLSNELSKIKVENTLNKDPVTVVLDMEKLTHISPNAANLLKQTIAETNWKLRTIWTRNVPVDIQIELEKHGLGYTLH
jgi:anti-sigma B factor antagonist